jgi:hypothetical protein
MEAGIANVKDKDIRCMKTKGPGWIAGECIMALPRNSKHIGIEIGRLAFSTIKSLSFSATRVIAESPW